MSWKLFAQVALLLLITTVLATTFVFVYRGRYDDLQDIMRWSGKAALYLAGPVALIGGITWLAKK